MSEILYLIILNDYSIDTLNWFLEFHLEMEMSSKPRNGNESFVGSYTWYE